MLKRGWCPTLYAPMPSGDGLLVRVKPPAAQLTPAQAHTLAEAAARHGNGQIELTQRGNLQIRGLTPPSIQPFATAMIDAGLANPDPLLEARRAIIPPALLGEDPTMAAGAASLTETLEHAFAQSPAFANLPAKFAVAIDAGGILGGRPVAADLIAWTDGQTRGLSLATRTVAPAPVGYLPYGATHGAYGLAPPFAQLTAIMLDEAATLAAHHQTTLRVTPWRALLLARIPKHTTFNLPAWITDTTDPRLLITACIGHPACRQATVATRTAAATLRPTTPIHISGCQKGCAHPAQASVVLVGDNGRYNLVRNGRASDPATAAGLTFAEAAAMALRP